MKNNIIKRLIITCLALTVALSGTTVNANIVLSKKETTKYINTIAHRQMSTVKNPTHSSAGGEWTVMGLARAGKITNDYKKTYKKNLKKTLDSCGGELSKRTYTDYSRTVIALTSIGENPYNFYGYDVISPLAEMDNVTKQGLNGVAYALIALNCGDYNVGPQSGYDGRVGSREIYKELIVSAALPKGGWSLFSKKADVDMTAIAVQSLAPYYNKDAEVKKAINDGLKVLSERQKSNGGFESMGNENCESCSQVLTTISTLGISVKDKRFIKNGNTVLDGLMKYYDNGAFKHTEKNLVNQMATDQAFYALVAYRNTLANDPPLFNMKKVAVKKSKRKPASKKTNKKTNNKANNIVNNDNQINNSVETTKKNKKKNKKNEKITTTNPSTTVNIVKETTVNKKKEGTSRFALWWIGLILAAAASVTIAFFVFKKRS
ncbi:MAG: terpene cyclase/mutase family protein [Eubacterium sp.]|nr:terpene cyclase/mutase family protein [Eubacterium sp.]